MYYSKSHSNPHLRIGNELITMRILLTGGAGFIGSWVCESYIAESNEVVIVDNLSTGVEENIPPEVDFIECDINNKKKLEVLFKKLKPQVVNHHAAQINLRHSFEDPLNDATINVVGSLNLLELCRKHNVKKFIFASTGGAIYGNPKKIPVDENTKPTPLSPYGISKLCVEQYLDFYKKNFGIDYTSLRYANVYGGRQNPKSEAGVISIFCTAILKKEKIKIYGDGSQTRDFVYCEDVAEANTRALHSPGGIFNIGTSKETSVNEIVEHLQEISGNNPEKIHLPQREEEVKRISLDTRLARSYLNWQPKTCIRDGLAKTWIWYKNRYENTTNTSN